MKPHIRLFLFVGLSLSLLAKGKDEEAVDFMEIVGNVKESVAAREDSGELHRIALNLEQIPVDPSLNH